MRIAVFCGEIYFKIIVIILGISVIFWFVAWMAFVTNYITRHNDDIQRLTWIFDEIRIYFY